MAEPLEILSQSLAGRYDVERELGRGGMATVYLARDVRHGRMVAIKVIRPELVAVSGTERFLAEIKLTARLQHPHILGLIDSGVVTSDAGIERPFYVMPYVTGETLRARLMREGALPISEALSVLGEVADALACAHGEEIIHRDIKPENILLGQGHAMVVDFGVAKAVDRSSTGESLTVTGVTVGTPAYMAPEQAVGDPGLDYRVDLYALGVVAYEMLTGRTPFAGPDTAKMIAAVLTRPAPSLAAAIQVPPRLVALVAALLEREAAKRPESAASVRDTLRAILAEVTTSPSIAPPAARKRRVLIGMTAGAAALLGAGLLMSGRWRPARPTSTAPSARVALPRSVAVLPFENMNRDSTTDYFGDGLAEELISALGRLPGLRVASRTSTFALKGRNTGLADVGKRLVVSSVLESSVRREGDVVRITTRLVDVSRDSVLWSGEYTGQLRNVLYVQDSIARAIAVALSGALAGEPAVAATPPRSRDPDAYEDYLRGRRYLRQRKPGSMTAATRAFEAAIARDSTFAPAYAGLADAYSLAAPFESRPPHDVFPLAKKAATRALSLDSTLAEAHTSLGMVSMFYDWDWATAGRHLRRGVELNPSSAEGHLFYAWYLLFRGRLRDAGAEIARAYDVDPLSPVIATRHGNILSYQGQEAEAIRSFRHALELDSTFFFARVSLAVAFIRTGQRDSARAVVPRRAVQTGTGESALPAWVLAQLGDTAAVRQELDTYLAIRRRGYISADGLAGVYAVLGDTASALAQLDQAERDRGFTLPWLPLWPMFDGFRKTERYRRLVDLVGVVPP